MSSEGPLSHTVGVRLGRSNSGTQNATRPDRLDPLKAAGSPWRRPSVGAPARTCGGRALPGKNGVLRRSFRDVSRENEVFAGGGQNLPERGFDPRTFGL